MRDRTGPPSRLKTGCCVALPAISHSACSIPVILAVGFAPTDHAGVGGNADKDEVLAPARMHRQAFNACDLHKPTDLSRAPLLEGRFFETNYTGCERPRARRMSCAMRPPARSGCAEKSCFGAVSRLAAAQLLEDRGRSKTVGDLS